MKNMVDIILERWQLGLLLECDWCGYEIEEGDLVKTSKGPMHWSCSEDAQRRGCFKREVRETPWHCNEIN